MVMQLMPPINQQQQQQSRLVPMQELMRDIRRDTPTSNLEALRYMQTMGQQNPMAMPMPQTMSYMNQGGLVSLPVVYRGWGGIGSVLGSIGRGIGRGVKNIGKGISGAVKGITGGLSGLTGGEGSSDFLKQFVLTMLINAATGGSGWFASLGPTGRAMFKGAQAFLTPRIVGGLPAIKKKVTPMDLARAGVGAGMSYATDPEAFWRTPQAETGPVTGDAVIAKYAGEPDVPTEVAAADTLRGPMDIRPRFADDVLRGEPGLGPDKLTFRDAPDLGEMAYFQGQPENVAAYESAMAQEPTFFAPSTGLGQAETFVRNIPGKEVIGATDYTAPITVADLGKTGASTYLSRETIEEEKELRRQGQAAQAEADAIVQRYQQGQMEAAEFARMAMENPLVFERAKKPDETLEEMMQRLQYGVGTKEEARQYAGGRYYREDDPTVNVRYGGLIGEVHRRAGGPAFFEGRVPNTVDPRSDGMSDSETMLITNPQGTQPTGVMKISEDEYVMSAPDMAILGNGSPQAGAQVMDQFRQDLRTAAYGTQAHQPRLNQQQALQSLAHRAFG